jgi:3-oxoacyl-[acyl-carrier-protein] synthase-3
MQSKSELNQGKAQFTFQYPRIKGVVTTVGGCKLTFTNEAAQLGLTEKESDRLSKVIGLESRQVVRKLSTTTSDLCVQSAERLMSGLEIAPSSVGGLIFVSQSPDYAAPSTATSMQNRLGLPVTAMAFDMRLGCSGFIYGLNVAFSLVESGLERVLLCVGDVASRLVATNDHSITPIMGDAGSAILIERDQSKSFFQLYSDGSGERALYVPNSGLRIVQEDVGLPSLMKMDGAQVFNFTLQRVPAMIDSILSMASLDPDEIDYFVLHQPNRYILTNIQKRLGIDDRKFPKGTQAQYGNQNSASIPGTISGFLSDPYSSGRLQSVFAGFGIGLSWGACIVETDHIFAPAVCFEKD